MNVVVNDLFTHYEMQGQGRVVLLLHGWGDNLQGLTALRQELAKQFKVVSVDLPGFGTTQAPKEIWDLDNYAGFVRDFLAKIQVAPYAIIGHSNGGALAIRGTALTLLQPEKLVLIAASGIRTGQSAKRLAFKTVAKTGKVATFWLPKRLKTKMRKKLYGVAGSDLLVAEHLQETFKKTVRQDVQADAARLKLPTLLIYADADDAVPVADGETYQKLIGNSRLVIIEGAGHFVHLEQTDRVSHEITEFLV